MKKFVSLLVLVFAVSAQANQPKTYKCTSGNDGSKTPDSFTIQVSDKAVVVSQYGKTEPQTSFHRSSKQNIPQSLGSHYKGGSKYSVAKNGNSFFSLYNKYNYEVMYVFASNGLIRQNASGNLHVVYKQTSTAQPSTNLNEWNREYNCEE